MLKDRVHNLCVQNGTNIKALEEALGLSKSSIVKWDKVSPKAENLQKVADYFGVSVDYLLGRDPVPTNQEQPNTEAIELAKQIKSLPPNVRDNIEQQIKLWASQDKK